MATTAELIAAADAAILALLTDKKERVELFGVSYQFQDIEKLYRIRDKLRSEADRLSRGHFRYADLRGD